MSTVRWREEGQSPVSMKGHRVLQRERLQACSDTAAYVFEDAAAEMAIDEVKKKKQHTFVSSCVILNDFFLTLIFAQCECRRT